MFASFSLLALLFQWSAAVFCEKARKLQSAALCEFRERWAVRHPISVQGAHRVSHDRASFYIPYLLGAKIEELSSIAHLYVPHVHAVTSLQSDVTQSIT